MRAIAHSNLQQLCFACCCYRLQGHKQGQDRKGPDLRAAATTGNARATATVLSGALNLGPGTAESKAAFLPSAFAVSHLILASISSTVVAPWRIYILLPMAGVTDDIVISKLRVSTYVHKGGSCH